MKFKMQHQSQIGWVAAGGLLFFLVSQWFRSSSSSDLIISGYPVLTLLGGFSAAAACLGIYNQSWLFQAQKLTLRRVLMTTLFLVVGLFELVHIVSFAEEISQQAMMESNFSLIMTTMGSLICSAGLLFIYTVKEKQVALPRKFLLFSATLGSFLILYILAIQEWSLMPKMLEGQKLGELFTIMHGVAGLMYVFSALILYVEWRKSGDFNLPPILCGVLCFMLGQGFLVLSDTVVDLNLLFGMLSNCLGYFFIQKGLYSSVVDTPFLQQQVAEAKMNYIAHHDDVTSLPNRRRLTQKLKVMMNEAVVEEKLVGVLVLNINRFKTINDSLGQQAANRVLHQVGQRLSHSALPGEEVFGLGRDEFAVTMTDFYGTDTAVCRTRSILQLFEKPVMVDGNEYHLTLGIGMAIFPYDGKSPEEMIQNADTALHSAKEQGIELNRYAHAMQMKAQERLQLENDLRKALARGQFYLVYQPQVNLQSGLVVGMEALVRWQHPQRGSVSPAEFIPLAEESGLIVPLGEWVLREACAQNKRWQEAGYRKLCVSVNLSMRQFRHSHLLDSINNILKETGLEPAWLELEITESMTFDKDRAFEQLRKIKEIGVHISIDDFGTGYSSLHYLKDLPIDRLKIDRSFVNEIMEDSNNAAIVSTITSMAHHLQLKVTAEGVENEDQMLFLRNQHCHEAQGYFFSKPIEAAVFEKKFLRDIDTTAG
ncbi:EAL domain-containing protein [Paenibacillus barcinonensis]|uniref:Diguanylate cyclase (GGDEF)-like protein n=1 Tax=Paenibacillus barcinonensis TaxID=198119 RepID=A0A2V4WJX9_PAEBA|nr:EAL domain-containing protein [Paenibacillus barcinonensis]PYE52678.1 diguanylate cyclase (GGDEF)-like protein [Paenibacillus barcinonensis]QKS59179.1 EAL domain-containing protein [Paenibacillus barcinonensis]